MTDAALEKRRKLAEMLRKRAAAPKDMPLSVGQERVYRLARLNPDVPLYNVAVAYRLRGPLDADAFARAVRSVETRHEILRTTFPTVDGAPVQRIAPAGSETFAQADVAADGIDAAIGREIGQSFDLATGPLWRAALLRVGAEDHVLTLTMHHIVTDGWSYEIFLKELRGFYAADAAPAPLPLQYAGYGEKQRAGLTGPDHEAEQAYWAEHLAGDIPALRLPFDHAGPAGREAASFPIAIPADFSQALADLSQREGATLFMTLLAGFEALLNRSTGQEDILLCTPVSGRHRAGSRDLIGYFNNILPMRLDASGDPSLLDLVRRTKTAALGAFKHQNVPFQQNADLPALRRIPLSRLLFSLDMEWPPKFDLPGAECEAIATDTGAADFDLSVSLWLTDGRIMGNLRFKPSLFDKATVAALATGYAAILAAMAEDPERALSSLPQAAPARDLGQAVDSAEDPSANLPRSALELRLARVWEDVFERSPIGIRDNLQALGASSLAVAALAERVQTEFQTDLSVTAIFQAGTVERMSTLLQSQDASLARSPLAPIQPNGTRPPLFLFEGVGVYYPLAPYLGDDQPIYGLITEIGAEFPGVEALVAHYLDIVLETQPEGPYFLGGLSFGGVVAFEMALQLKALGHEVGLLALFDTPGPNAYRMKPPLRRALGHLRNTVRFGRPYVEAKLGHRLRALTGAKSAPAVDEPERLRPLLRVMFERTAGAYRYKPYPGRITLFTLAERHAMSDSLIDPELADIDPLLGWGAIAEGGVERHELDGEHISILREPYVRALGEELSRCIARAGQ